MPNGLDLIPVSDRGNLFLADISGKILKQFTSNNGVGSFLMSPDGSYIAYMYTSGTFAHPGVAMYFGGTLNLKILDVATGKEVRNIFLGDFTESPSIEYFWSRDNKYVYLTFNQANDTETGYSNQTYWMRYDVSEIKNKALIENEFNQTKKLATVTIAGGAELTRFNYPALNNIKEQSANVLLGDLFDRISLESKKDMSKRFEGLTKDGFVSNANILFSPNLEKSIVFLRPTSCENITYMITYATPIFIIDMKTGNIIEIREPHRFLSAVWIDDANFLIDDDFIYKISLSDNKYAIQKFLPETKKFSPTCKEEYMGPAITMPCDDLGESLGPTIILSDPCSA